MMRAMQKTDKGIDIFYATNRAEWRRWLEENHADKPSVWLVQYKKNSDMPSISWSDAVDEALCFGWIDSIKKKLDEHATIQFFGPRKPKSVWSKINKAKVQRLTDEGQMRPAGQKCIDTAKQNGSWNMMDDVEELVVPPDLERAFKTRKGAKDYFMGLSKSVRKGILAWVAMAKRPETRQKRIDEIATLAARQLKPKQF